MNLEEYQQWQEANKPKSYSKSSKSKWRKQVITALEQAIAGCPNSDLATAINNSYPFRKIETGKYLIWLEERRNTLKRLNLPTH